MRTTTKRSTYVGRGTPGLAAVRDAMSISRVRLGEHRLPFAREEVLHMAGMYATEFPEDCAEYVRHAASSLRVLERELRDLQHDKTAGIVAYLRTA
jgi:hypothetical protein